MVNLFANATFQTAHFVLGLLLADEEAQQPLFFRLDPQQRAKVLMALLGLVLVGMALVSMAYLGGRHLRRIAGKVHGPTPRSSDEWYRKPLHPQRTEPEDDE